MYLATHTHPKSLWRFPTNSILVWKATSLLFGNTLTNWNRTYRTRCSFPLRVWPGFWKVMLISPAWHNETKNNNNETQNKNVEILVAESFSVCNDSFNWGGGVGGRKRRRRRRWRWVSYQSRTPLNQTRFSMFWLMPTSKPPPTPAHPSPKLCEGHRYTFTFRTRVIVKRNMLLRKREKFNFLSPLPRLNTTSKWQCTRCFYCKQRWVPIWSFPMGCLMQNIVDLSFNQQAWQCLGRALC